MIICRINHFRPISLLLSLFFVLLTNQTAQARNPFISPAFQQLIEQAEQQQPQAQFELARRYYLGEGIASDKATALKWLAAAASQNHLAAQNALSQLLLDGDDGVAADVPQAVEWLEKSANLADPNAIATLITLYKEGKILKRDYAKARFWAEQGDALGYAEAEYQLGTFHHFGLGIDKNVEKAAEFYTKAAHKGHFDALNNMGGMYFGGIGVPADKVKGYAYWLVAKAKGNEFASRNLAIKDSQNALNDKEKQQAERQAEQLLKQIQ